MAWTAHWQNVMSRQSQGEVGGVCRLFGNAKRVDAFRGMRDPSSFHTKVQMSRQGTRAQLQTSGTDKMGRGVFCWPASRVWKWAKCFGIPLEMPGHIKAWEFSPLSHHFLREHRNWRLFNLYRPLLHFIAFPLIPIFYSFRKSRELQHICTY
jgi:hypothetical protein